MSWKAIGCSVTGTSHHAINKPCEDSIRQKVFQDINGNEVLICCVCDGAGSARHAAFAADYCTGRTLEALHGTMYEAGAMKENDILNLAEDLYAGLEAEAVTEGEELNEYSCTFLGCVITTTQSIFWQLGDGAIVRGDDTCFYTPVWWPDNGEYQNTTSFLIDDKGFGQLNIKILDEQVNEVAVFSDGLQMLALNMEKKQAHQPFFNDLFKYLRMATDDDKINVLNRKLAEYLDSKAINDRTDDDKTLFLATRLEE